MHCTEFSQTQLCVVVRYYDESLMRVTSCFSLIDIARGDASTFFDALKLELDKDMVLLSNIVGYTSDRANVMMIKLSPLLSLVMGITLYECFAYVIVKFYFIKYVRASGVLS